RPLEVLGEDPVDDLKALRGDLIRSLQETDLEGPEAQLAAHRLIEHGHHGRVGVVEGVREVDDGEYGRPLPSLSSGRLAWTLQVWPAGWKSDRLRHDPPCTSTSR